MSYHPLLISEMRISYGVKFTNGVCTFTLSGEMLSASAAHAIPVKVQGLKDFLFGGSLIDADITYSA